MGQKVCFDVENITGYVRWILLKKLRMISTVLAFCFLLLPLMVTLVLVL
jgi:hypothetical protein